MIHLYKTGVIVILLSLASYSHAASTPDELAKLLIQAIEESNLEKYESLIYPASLKLQKERSMEMYKKQMGLRFNRNIIRVKYQNSGFALKCVAFGYYDI